MQRSNRGNILVKILFSVFFAFLIFGFFAFARAKTANAQPLPPLDPNWAQLLVEAKDSSTGLTIQGATFTLTLGPDLWPGSCSGGKYDTTLTTTSNLYYWNEWYGFFNDSICCNVQAWLSVSAPGYVSKNNILINDPNGSPPLWNLANGGWKEVDTFLDPTPISQPDLVIRNSTNGTNPVVDVSAPATVSGSTINATAGDSFTISFNTRNIGGASAGTTSCTLMEAFGSNAVANACGHTDAGKQWFSVPNLASNTSAAHSISLTYATAGTYNILLRVDEGNNIAESNETNDFPLVVNVINPQSAPPSDLNAIQGCSGATPSVQFRFTDNSNSEDSFILEVNGAAWTGNSTPTPYGTKTITSSAADKTAINRAVSFTWSVSSLIDSGDVNPSLAGNQLGPENTKTYYWRVKAHNSTSESAYIYPTNSVDVPGTSFVTRDCRPDLAVRNATDGTNPAVNVSAPATISGNTISATAGVSFTISFHTRNIGLSSTVNSSCTLMEAFGSSVVANACGHTDAGKQWFSVPNLASLSSASHTVTLSYASVGTYFILLRADEGNLVAEADENNDIYLTVNVLSYDLSASLINSPATNNFDIGETVSFTVHITNNSASGPVPPTQLYFFPDGSSGLPQCSTGGPGVTTPPTDSAGTSLSYTVSPSGSPIGPNGTQDITVSFKVSTNPVSNRVAYAYVVPSCSFSPSSGIDENFANNLSSGFTYSVAANGFIETTGGDIGALGSNGINVSFNSSTITPTPLYQSDYAVVADTLGSNVSSKSNWTMRSYTTPQVAGGGVYDYMSSRFKANAKPTCDFESSKPLSICTGNFTYDLAKANAGVNEDHVVFVIGNLNIEKNLTLASSDLTLVFVVSGNITVNLDVTEVDAVMIAKGGFSDSQLAASSSGVSSASNFLTIRGAVYLDGNGGSLQFKRYFTGPYNKTTPSDKIIFEPKYLAKSTMLNMLGVKSIKWTEINP